MAQHDHHHCLGSIDLLNDYLDGELSAESCAELEDHLRQCPECESLLSSLRQTVNILHHLDDLPPPLPPTLEERLISQMQRHMQTRPH